VKHRLYFYKFQGKEQSSENEKETKKKKKGIEWEGNMSIIQREAPRV
jgi:hypothetical protein